MTPTCCKCGNPATKIYPPIGPLCYSCEQKPLSASESAGCAAYCLLLLALPFLAVGLLALAGM